MNTEPACTDAVSTLYPVAYTLKALGRDRHGRDARVMPLEALWWADDPIAFTSRRDKSRRRWTVMIVVPPWLDGPYDDEGPLLARMHDEVIPARGLRMTGRHHEIHLGNPRRAAPERLRTILRQPVRRE